MSFPVSLPMCRSRLSVKGGTATRQLMHTVTGRSV